MFIKSNWLFLTIGLSLGILAFIYRGKIVDLFIDQTKPRLFIGIEGLYTSKTLPKEITNKISYGLTTHSINDKPELSTIVESLDIKNDNKEYTITFKDNLFWHDGKKFKATDVKYEIDGVKVKTDNENQLTLSLSKAYSPILSLLDEPIFKNNLNGLGEYKVVSTNYQDGFVKKLRLKSTSSNTNDVTYKFYQNERELLSAFMLGEVDQVKTTTIPEEVEKWSNIKITQEIDTETEYVAIFLNTMFFTSKQIRQALSYATPKTHDKNIRCIGPISTNSWAYNPMVKEYNYSQERAIELFKDSGINEISLSVVDRRLLPTAEVIKKAWSESLNINVNISIIQNYNQSYDALLAFGSIPHDPDQYLYWHSTQAKTNITHLNNSRIDKLLEEGRQTFDQIKRKQIYLDFQRYLLEESPAIFISYPTYYTLTRN